MCKITQNGEKSIVNKLSIKPNDKMLVVAPHPDDETIGCGGLLSRFADQCEVLLLTDGRVGGDPKVRINEFHQAMDAFGVNVQYLLDLKDGGICFSERKIIDFDYSKYSKIFVTGDTDCHMDHRAAFFSVIEGVKASGGNLVYKYEVGTPLTVCSDYLDISDVIEKKKTQIGLYKSQLNTIDYVKSAEGLALFRGSRSGEMGVGFAEAYSRYLVSKNDSERLAESIREQRYKCWFTIYNIWIKKILQGCSIGDYLKKRRLFNVTIYGYGQLGKRLAEDINRDKEFHISIIDNKLYKEIQSDNIICFNDFDGNTDIVIVTALLDHEEIKSSILTRYPKCCVMGLDEIVEMI